MDKVIRNGKVAVIFSPDYGGAWSSWYGDDKMIFDPNLVQLIESENEDAIDEYCERVYERENPGLSIGWVPEGEDFVILEYDGYERICLKNTFEWIKA